MASKEGESLASFLQDKDAPQKQSVGFSERLVSIATAISMEPILMLNMTTVALVQVISQSWLLRLACDEVSEANCRDSSDNSTAVQCRVDCSQHEIQADIQKTVAEVQAWRSAIEFSVALLLVPFLGAWSDGRKNGRLPVMLFALSGRTVQQVVALGLLLLPSPPSLMVVGVSLAVPVALTASSMAVDMAAYSYISDTTVQKMRTMRLGLANACWCFGSVLGLLLSGLLLQAGGEILVFSTGLALQTVCCLICIWRMRGLGKAASEATSEEEEIKKKIDCFLVVESIGVAFAKRPGKARVLILLMLFNLFLAFGASCGRQAIMFMYSRLRFQWDEVEYGLYGTFLMLMEVIGSVIAMAVFSHKLRLPDTIVGLMSCVSQVLSSTFYTFAKSTLGMYIAPLVEVANGQVVVIPRAIVTKLTESHEQGKVHALFGCVEAVVPLVFEPLYNSLYAATLDTVPETVFWLSAALTLPPTLLFVWLQWGHGKNWIPSSREPVKTDKSSDADLTL